MNDRELLALAAKAVSIDIQWSDRGDSGYWGKYRGMPQWIEWNPLSDDGDALRLAVKLRIQGLHFYPKQEQVTATYHDPKDKVPEGFVIEEFDLDENKAVRRAIVRAAARIGSLLK